MNILIAEDDENSRVLLESALAANGYEVLSAENGAVALALARHRQPGLIISDILMPKMDGYAFCKAVKSDPLLKDIPFVFYTATYTDPSDERLAMDLGASRFIVKPMEIDIFLREISTVLENYKAEKLFVVNHPLASDQDLRTEYTEVLAKKLEQKVLQLEEEKKRLKESEKKYRRLVEALRGDYYFYTYNTRGILTYVSPSITNVLGYTPEEFLVHFSEYHTGNVINDGVVHDVAASIEGMSRPQHDVEIYHKDGSVHRFVVTEEPVFDQHGKVIEVEGIAHDITARLAIEENLAKAKIRLAQSQKMEAIGTLAGGIAHDFNNILTLIIGYTQMTQLEFSKESQNWQDLQEVLLAAYRATDLARQILSFSRQTDKAIQPVRVQDIIGESLKLLRPSIPSTITILESIDGQCQPVMADPTQMHQILMNLCTNAYYAMRNSGGTLAITLSEIEVNPGDIVGNINVKKGEYLHLEVSDTGTGIMPEVLDRIFEPYYTTKPKGEGTGLGLAVVHGIVTGHRGDITVYSEIGKGTTFNVYLPVTAAHQLGDEMLLHKETPGGSERIMLVDDDSVIIKLEKKHLKSLGYQVTALTSGVEAVEVFNAAPGAIDLVITDMTMPKMTGAELAQTLLKIRPDLPIILCTGYSSLIDREKALAMGIRQYLMKPLSVNDLARTVRQILDQQFVDI